MSELPRQIDVDANARLVLPRDCAAAQAADAWRRFLRLETHRIRLAHRRGASGRACCEAQSRVWDRVLTSLLERAAADGGFEGAQPGSTLAMAAVGGYGRRDLNPASGIELLILRDDGASVPGGWRTVVEWIQAPDLAGVFGRVRALAQTMAGSVEAANRDSWTKTALLDARFIGGDARLFTQFQEVFTARCVEGQAEAFIAAWEADREARRAKFGRAVCLQEPHIKSGCGGLRDSQSLLWLAFFRHGCRTLVELEARGLVAQSERRDLERAYDFLLRVRNEAHYQAGRAADVLTKSIQPAVARGLGYAERSYSRRIERFMRDYYRHARTIDLLTRGIGERLGLVPLPPRPSALPARVAGDGGGSPAYVMDGFEFIEDRIRAAGTGVFREDPARLMRVFRHAQQRGARLDPATARLVREEVTRAGSLLRSAPGAAETFLEVLNQRGNVAPTLRAMHEAGVLGAYLPAFGRLTCLVQHEFFHQYTADEHTLVCIAKLDELAGCKDGPRAAYGDIFNRAIERPYLLYLALLLHDAGKARLTKDHAEVGGRIAAGVARRLGLDAASSATLRFLVRHHLDMVSVSQRRDLDEPAEIRRFAALLASVDRLNLLTLLTIADSLGTSDDLWNGFKDSLLLTLYERTRALLAGERAFARAESRQRERLAEEVRTLLPEAFPADEIAAHFTRMPPRYFLLREAKAIAADLELAHRFIERALAKDEDPLEPVAQWQHDRDRGYSVVRIATWDRGGLFSRFCGALTAAGLSVLSAEVFTRDDSIVIDTFIVVEARRGAPAGDEEQQRVARHLREAGHAGRDLHEAIEARRKSLPARTDAGWDPIPTVIRFDNESGGRRTVLEIEAEDRIGLLYTIAQVLSQLDVDISVAKICTERGAAMDTFYIAERDGSRIEAPARCKEIEQRLRDAIRDLDYARRV